MHEHGGVEGSGFSVVLLAAVESPRPGHGYLEPCASAFGCEIEPLDTDPLPLGDRDVVLEALGAAASILDTGRGAAYEYGGVTKLVTPESGIVVIERVETPYWDDTESIVAGVDDAALARAIEDHRGFVEVGLLGLEVVEDAADASRRLCRLAAAICSPDIVAIAIPEMRLLDAPTPTVLAALCSEDPFAWPASSVADAPARRIAVHDDGFDHAVSKAQSAWPTLVAAFAEPNGRTEFAVKIGVVERGVCENLWFRLVCIDDAWIECALESAPIYLTGIVPGDRRRFPVGDVLDWVYVEDDGMRVGGFTF